MVNLKKRQKKLSCDLSSCDEIVDDDIKIEPFLPDPTRVPETITSDTLDKQEDYYQSEIELHQLTHINQPSRFEEKILEELSFLRNKLISIEKKLSVQKSKRAHLYDAPEGMPMDSVEEFETFEQADEEQHDNLQEYLEYLGGSNIRDALNKFVRATITCELAQNFTWFGKTDDNGIERGALYKTKLMRIFFDAAQKKKEVRLDEFVHHMTEVWRSFKQTLKKTAKEIKSPSERGVRKRRNLEMIRHFESK